MNISEYWEQKSVVSMSDPRVSRLESEIISRFVKSTDSVLNVGCGDGSGCFLYRDKCKSYTGLEKSKEMMSRFKSQSTHSILQGDILEVEYLGKFSCIISQRCIINLETLTNQTIALKKMINFLEEKGTLIICEAFEEGLNNLNEARTLLGVKPIIPHWHSLYLSDDFFENQPIKLIAEHDLSGYFLLTRVLHAALVEVPLTDSKINELAEKLQLENKLFQNIKDFSFIKIKVFEKC